jgi:predicted HTH domain antitoxin
MSNLVEKLDFAEQVGKLYLQGKNPTDIARQLDASRALVLSAISDFKAVMRRESETAIDIRDRLVDIMFEADESFRMVIDEAWSTVREADNAGELRNKISALKIVETATKSRADMVQKAGMGQDEDIINQLNENERKQQVLIKLLKEIRDSHPEVAELIATRLSQIQDEVEYVTIEYRNE